VKNGQGKTAVSVEMLIDRWGEYKVGNLKIFISCMRTISVLGVRVCLFYCWYFCPCTIL